MVPIEGAKQEVGVGASDLQVLFACAHGGKKSVQDLLYLIQTILSGGKSVL